MLKRMLITASLIGLVAAGSSSLMLPLTAAAAIQDPPRPALTSTGRVRIIVKNANDCAPNVPVAVYAPNMTHGAPLGYRCARSSNGN